MNVIPTVGVLIFKDDTILLVKHGEKASHITGAYGLPAGRLEPGETTVQAAIRELEEETGLIAAEDDLEKLPLKIPVADIKRKDGIKKFSITVFLCRKFSGTLKAAHETIPEWVPIEEIDTYPLIANTGQIVKEGMEFL